MNEDIIKWAREADPGFDGGPDADGTMLDSIVGIAAIERFAALVRADEREACANLMDDMAAQDKLTNYYKVAARAIRERKS